MEKSCLLFKPKVLHITIAKDIYSNDSITIGAIKIIFRNDITFLSLSINSKLLTLNVWILFVDGTVIADSKVCCRII